MRTYQVAALNQGFTPTEAETARRTVEQQRQALLSRQGKAQARALESRHRLADRKLVTPADLDGTLLLLAYSLGLGVPFILVGVGIGRLLGALRRITRQSSSRG